MNATGRARSVHACTCTLSPCLSVIRSLEKKHSSINPFHLFVYNRHSRFSRAHPSPTILMSLLSSQRSFCTSIHYIPTLLSHTQSMTTGHARASRNTTVLSITVLCSAAATLLRAATVATDGDTATCMSRSVDCSDQTPSVAMLAMR